MSVAQTYTMPTGTGNSNITTCSGTFYDNGGAGGNYAANCNSTITFCPGTPGQLIRVTFTNYDTENLTDDPTFLYDYLDVYNGTTVSAPNQLTTMDLDFTNQIIYESSDPSGCLTFNFISDGSVQQAGWTATVSCFTPCNPPIANVATVPAAPQPLLICPGASVSLTGAGSSAQPGFSLSNYSWNYGDGSAAGSGVTTSHTYTTPGIYYIHLTVTDNNGNVQTCIATVTVVDNIPPTAICQNATVSMDANGLATITASTINNGSFDNCNPAAFSGCMTKANS